MKGENSGKSALDHVLKYTGVFGGVQGLNILMSIVRTKLTSYLLGPIGFALMGVYVSVSEFVSSTSNLGVPFASVRHLSEVFARGDSREVSHWVLVIRTWCFWISLFAALLCVAGAHWLDSGLARTPKSPPGASPC